MLENRINSIGETHQDPQENNLEGKVKVGFRDIWKQMNWKDKLILGVTTAFSAVTAGPLMTFSMGAVNMIVYKLVQKKARQRMTKKGVLAESIFANLYSPYGVGLYSIFHGLTSIASKLLFGFGVMVPVSLGLYFPIKHILHNYSFREFSAGLFNGKVWKDSYHTIRENFPKAYKKIMVYGSLPLFLFWAYTPPALQSSQPFIHGTVGAVGRIALKYTVDKDIKGLNYAARLNDTPNSKIVAHNKRFLGTGQDYNSNYTSARVT